jgi:hypothetical protein
MSIPYYLIGLLSILWLYQVAPVVWLWCRARYMLRHLPREPEDGTSLYGSSLRTQGRQRHYAYRGIPLNLCGRRFWRVCMRPTVLTSLVLGRDIEAWSCRVSTIVLASGKSF